MEHSFQFFPDRPDLRCLAALCRDPFLCIEIFHQGKGQGQDREDAHDQEPEIPVGTQCRHDHHREYERHDDPAHHNSRDIIKDGQASPLCSIPRRQGHHQGMAHIVDRIGDGIKEVVGKHDPDDLDCLRGARHGKQQDRCDWHQDRRQEQPGTRFAFF